MKRHDMAGFMPRKRRVTTTADSAHGRPDLLRGDFGAARPDEAWVGDISYIRTRQGFLYLAFVLDLASRRVVGISMAPHLKASLATDALREAIATRGGQVRGVVFHTDRGSQYTSEATARLSKAYDIRQSVGRTTPNTEPGSSPPPSEKPPTSSTLSSTTKPTSPSKNTPPTPPDTPTSSSDCSTSPASPSSPTP